MLSMPRRVKWRKHHRGRMKGFSYRANQIAFGEFGLKIMEPCMLNAKQIEAVRVAIVRTVKKGAKLWFRVFPDYPFTKKPLETRMGKGKGEPEEWRARIHPGRILVEIAGPAEDVCLGALRIASYKLGVKTKIVRRIAY